MSCSQRCIAPKSKRKKVEICHNSAMYWWVYMWVFRKCIPKENSVHCQMKAHWCFKLASTSECICLSITLTHISLGAVLPAPGKKRRERKWERERMTRNKTGRQLEASPVKPPTPEGCMTIQYQGAIHSLQLPQSSAIKLKLTVHWSHYYIQLIHFDQQNSDRWCVSTQIIDLTLMIGVNDKLHCIDSALLGGAKWASSKNTVKHKGFIKY